VEVRMVVEGDAMEVVAEGDAMEVVAEGNVLVEEEDELVQRDVLSVVERKPLVAVVGYCPF